MQSRSSAAGSAALPPTNRWLQLIIAILCMVMIANLQYGWTLFVQPMNTAHGWSVADIQIAFSLFVALETWLTPIEGWLVDWVGAKNGPRWMVAFGGVTIALGWVVNSVAQGLPVLYLGAILSGTGAGAIYATCVGNAVKWFPDHRGLAVGLTAAGFGAGAALTVVPIREVIAAYGYGAAFFWFGLIQGGVIFVLAWWMRAPVAGETPSAAASRVLQTAESYSPKEMLGTPVFWVLYLMFVMVSASGLMATAQVALIAKDFHVADAAILAGVTTADRGPPRRQCRQWAGAAAFRLDFRPDRPRKHDGDRLQPGRRQLLAARLRLGTVAMGLRRLRRAHFPHLGRDLQPVSVDLHRQQLRVQVRDRESGVSSTRRRAFSAFLGAGGQPDQVGKTGGLAHGVRRHRDQGELRGGGASAPFVLEVARDSRRFDAGGHGVPAGVR